MKYYVHQKNRFGDIYFEKVGIPVQVSFLKYKIFKFLGYIVTKAPDEMTLKDVHVKAQIENGADPTSYLVERTRKFHIVIDALEHFDF